MGSPADGLSLGTRSACSSVVATFVAAEAVLLVMTAACSAAARGGRPGAKRDAETALSLVQPADPDLVGAIQRAALISNAMEAAPPGRLIKS
jgi:hypothetical protein